MGCIPSKDSAAPTKDAVAAANSSNSHKASMTNAVPPSGNVDEAVAGLSSQGVKFNDAYKIGKEVRERERLHICFDIYCRIYDICICIYSFIFAHSFI